MSIEEYKMTNVVEDEKTLLVAGDLAPLRKPGELLNDGKTEQVFGNVLSVIEKSDLFIANLECPLTLSERRYNKAGPNLKGKPAVAPTLAKAGLEVVSLANNHIFDYGLAGVKDTIRTLEKNGIRWYGVGENLEQASKPCFINLSELNVAFLSYAEHEFNWHSDSEWCASMLEPAQNVLQIQEVSKECDKLIVFLHCGPEGTNFPSPRMVKLCRAFAEAGASAVLVSHAHAIMGSEVYQGVPIVYGLGNFLFQPLTVQPPSWRLGLMTRLSITGRGNVKMEQIPIIADEESGCISLLPEHRQGEFTKFYRSISNPLENMEEIKEYWKLFCASQASHLTKEIFKGLMAMVPGIVLSRFFHKKTHGKEDTYYRKGASLLRGLLVCENHQDVLGGICDMLREDRFNYYYDNIDRLKAKQNQDFWQ